MFLMTDHSANATSHDWRPFIPCDGSTANSLPRHFSDCVQKTTENILVL